VSIEDYSRPTTGSRPHRGFLPRIQAFPRYMAPDFLQYLNEPAQMASQQEEATESQNNERK
jgi:hypothetical protein